MTFKSANLTQWNVSPTPPKRGLPQWWGYYTTDNMATVQAADYFNLNTNPPIVIGRNTTWYIGDQIYCVCSDGVTELQISAVTPNVTTTAGNANIPAGSIQLAMLESGIAPQAVIKYSAKYTTVGGAAAEAIAIAGVLATDLAFVQLVNHGPNTVSVAYAVTSANTLTVTFSADPGAGAIIDYQVIRTAV